MLLYVPKKDVSNATMLSLSKSSNSRNKESLSVDVLYFGIVKVDCWNEIMLLNLLQRKGNNEHFFFIFFMIAIK